MLTLAPIVEGKLPEHVWMDVDTAILGADEHIALAVAEDVGDEVVAQLIVACGTFELMGYDGFGMGVIDVESLCSTNPEIAVGIFAERGDRDIGEFSDTLESLLGDVITADTSITTTNPQHILIRAVIECRNPIRNQPILHVVVGMIARDDRVGAVHVNQTVGLCSGPYITGFIDG